ncbi:efflux RND transporter periplasmic adaptor subunit [Puniceicoccaceae bacterium K14]|nr:efflux RND transporter periplasmic adaptor subunit [Puniceicoccaceae bacterium K14]
MKAYLIPSTALTLLLTFTSCDKQTTEVASAPRPVFAITVPEPSSTLQRSFSGQIYAAEAAALSFEVSGRVTSIYAKQGQRYDAGDTLATLDASDYQNNLNTAQASLTQAEQALRRLQRLFESGNSSQSQLDEAIAAEQSARGNYEQSLKAVEDTTLAMPYSGIIATVEIDAQQVVSTGQTAMTIEGSGPMEFEFGIPTDVVNKISKGHSVSIEIGDLEGRSFPATISEISPGIQENTTYGVTAQMDIADPAFRSGMDGEATIELARANGGTLQIPLICVFSSANEKRFVWIAQSQSDNTATIEKREVSVGQLEANGYVSILSGLKTGEHVVSRGVNKIQEGQTVLLKTEG